MSDLLVIDGFVIDLTVSIEEPAESEASQFPVEQGAPVSDHVVNKPRTMSIEFMVSDTPIGAVFDLRSPASVPSTEARAFLEELRDSKKPFVVEYGDRRWENQIFTSLTFAEDAGEKSGGLFATANLQTFRFVDVQRVVVQRVVASSAKFPGRKMWLCPVGTPVSLHDAENKRHHCRVVVKEFGYYRFDDGPREALSDEDMARLGVQNINRDAGTQVFTDDVVIDPVTGRLIRRDTPITVLKDMDMEKFLGVPADYEPESPAQERFEETHGRF